MEEYSAQLEDIYGYKVVTPNTSVAYLTSGFHSKALSEIDPLSKDWNEENLLNALTYEELEDKQRRNEEYQGEFLARVEEEQRIADQSCIQKLGIAFINLFRR
jgi:hypothetical protein